VPFIVGNIKGLDFRASVKHPANQGRNFTVNNFNTMGEALDALGKPDLVVSDYEPISAQYAYMMDSPLVTIDPLSKFFSGNYPKNLGGQSYLDEVMRLKLFFPRADKRISYSFFFVPESKEIEVCGPIIRESVLDMKKSTQVKDSLLIYLSLQYDSLHNHDSIISACGDLDINVNLFLKDGFHKPVPTNVKVFKHGDKKFDELLGRAYGIVSTTGHTLLSEAMFLGTPVYGVPLPLYEQKLNAKIISDNGFGVTFSEINAENLREFVSNIPSYRQNIENDHIHLNREPSQVSIINTLESML